MAALFIFFFTLFLIVLQTVIFPSFAWFIYSFDLLIIEVLFLCLVFSHYTVVFVIIFLGCVMDSISGSPLGFHLFSYIWVYIIVTIVKQMLFKQSVIFILVISFVAVIIQHVLLLFFVYVSHGNHSIWDLDFSLLMQQAFWGVVFISPGIWLANVCWENWKFVTKFMQEHMVPK